MANQARENALKLARRKDQGVFGEIEVVKEIVEERQTVFQMNRHVNGTIKFSVADKPNHKVAQNTKKLVVDGTKDIQERQA